MRFPAADQVRSGPIVMPDRITRGVAPPFFQPASIIVGSAAAAVAYGLVHDQITIRACPEYFTVTHPRITPSDSLTIIALSWGVAATWWVGAALGLLLAVAARLGSEPRVPARHLGRPVLLLLGLCAGLVACAGVVGYVLACAGVLGLTGELAANIPGPMHARWFAAWWTHTASYAGGALGGLVLVAWTLRARWKTSLAIAPRSRRCSLTESEQR